MNSQPTKLWLSGNLLILLSLCGCSNPAARYETGAEVRGIVRLNDRLLPAGTIRFSKIDDESKSSQGAIRADGSYVVLAAPVGECVVMIETESTKINPRDFAAMVPDEVLNKMPPSAEYVKINRKFADPNKTPLRATVAAGKNEHNFQVD